MPELKRNFNAAKYVICLIAPWTECMCSGMHYEASSAFALFSSSILVNKEAAEAVNFRRLFSCYWPTLSMLTYWPYNFMAVYAARPSISCTQIQCTTWAAKCYCALSYEHFF